MKLVSLLMSVLFTLAAAPLPAHSAEAPFRTRASAGMATSAEAAAADTAAETAFGKDVAARVLGRYRLSGNAALTRYVNLVGKAVAANADRPELPFRFAVLATDTVNAWAAPGGYVFVTQGALSRMQDEAELAAVLAHEVAHVSRRHIVRELNIRGSEGSPEAGLAHLLGGVGDPTRVAFNQALDKAVKLLFDAGMKQEDELEADRVGTLLLAATGYDATALRTYVARLGDARGETTRKLETTHPPLEKRLAILDEVIRTEHLARTSAPRVTQRFRQYMR
jgi:predicted Zn-dependent protease